MNKLKISNSEMRLLLLLLSLICIACSYFFIFQNTTAKANEINALNEEKQQKITEMEQMIARKDLIEADTITLNETVMDIINKYPSDLTTEKAFMVVEEIEKATEVHISNICLIMDNSVGSLGSTTVLTEEGTLANGTAENVGYYATISMNYEAKYDAFKDMIDYINNLKDRVTIPSVSATYDNETGLITGVITVNMYYLSETGKAYEAPKINGIGSGVDNIFESTGVRNGGYLQSEVGIDENEEEDAEADAE